MRFRCHEKAFTERFYSIGRLFLLIEIRRLAANIISLFRARCLEFTTGGLEPNNSS
jgi:hypothetical protein